MFIKIVAYASYINITLLVYLTLTSLVSPAELDILSVIIGLIFAIITLLFILEVYKDKKQVS